MNDETKQRIVKLDLWPERDGQRLKLLLRSHRFATPVWVMQSGKYRNNDNGVVQDDRLSESHFEKFVEGKLLEYKHNLAIRRTSYSTIITCDMNGTVKTIGNNTDHLTALFEAAEAVLP